jgi:hypothetical protein
VIKITLLVSRIWFPPDQSNKVAKAYVDFLKDNPPDKSIEKTIAIAVGSDEDGTLLVYGIGEIMKGMEKEVLKRTTKQNLFMASKIDGLKYKVEIFLDFTEAYKILGMTAPDV